MIFKPDEVTSLKKGSHVFVEVKEGDLRVLKRNFCGVYELYKQNFERDVEYFEDLNLFKNRYGNVHKKFLIYNLSAQRLDIYPVVEKMNEKEILKWFSEYGSISYHGKKVFDGIEINYYSWISDMDKTRSTFQLMCQGESCTLNISISQYLRRNNIAV